jgi:hypothetical protein
VKRGRQPKGSPKAPLRTPGITKKQSSRWQKLGAIPQADFDFALEQAEKPTTNGVIRATGKPKSNPVASEVRASISKVPLEILLL